MGRVNASNKPTATSAPQAAAAPKPAPAPEAKTAAPAPKPLKKAAPAPAPAPAVEPVASAPRPIVRMGMTFGPTETAPMNPQDDFYTHKMREVEALRERRALGPKEMTLPLVPGYRSAAAYGGTGSTGGTVTLPAAGDYSLKMEPQPGLPRTFSARATPEAMTVTTSNQEEFVRRGERLGERYASLRRTLLDLADTRRELEALKRTGAPAATETALYGGTTDERLKSLASRTQRVNQDLAQTLADLREFGINEREAKEQYGNR